MHGLIIIGVPVTDVIYKNVLSRNFPSLFLHMFVYWIVIIIIITIGLLCLHGHLRFLLSSTINLKKKKKNLTLYTNQILLSNSSESSQICPLKFIFLPLFLKSSNLILRKNTPWFIHSPCCLWCFFKIMV